MGPRRGGSQAQILTLYIMDWIKPLTAIVTSDYLSAAYSYLMTVVFPGIIRSDPTLLHQIRTFDGDLQLVDDAFMFTLPDLFRLVCKLFAPHSKHQIEPNQENYLRFRKLLYSNPTNSQLQQLGGRVEVELASSQHELSIYKLNIVRSNCDES